MARLLNIQALFLCEQGASEPALDLLQESLILAREAGDALGMMRAPGNQGWALHSAGRYQEALAAYEESIGLANLHNGPMIVAQVLGNRAHTLYALGKDAQALVLFKQVLQTAREIGVPWGYVGCLEGLGRLAARHAGTRQAVRWWGAAQAECERLQTFMARGHRQAIGKDVAEGNARQALVDEQFGNLWREGSNSASRRRWRRR
jgi:tetratricopeptide (TPR) repeat protein